VLARLAASETIWNVGKLQGHIEVREDLPSPETFFAEYVLNKGGPFEGVGKPALFRGAAAAMPAFGLWTDEYLRERHGAVRMDQIEPEKKETRLLFPHDDWTMEQFLDNYNKSAIYSTATTPEGLSDEVFLLPPINCGGFHGGMSQSVLWFSSGGTKSVIHSDGQHNFHCMISGRKDWLMWRPDSRIDTAAMGWVDAEKEAKKDPKFKDAYGAYGGRIDVDDVDLKRFPGWGKIKSWTLELEQGDCAYIPPRWFHHVEATPQRAISVHVWFHAGKTFNRKSCEILKSRGYNISGLLFRLSDCTWGFGEDGNRKPTKCKLRKSLAHAKTKQEL